ncbi:MAG TPA: HAMP domain-containing sensor histidine kinase [Allosphingosinicella sp.]|uniref:sensor histidine kinase n=1 Tax=Allosphingosinicella sp. TaxID=2823234 RepID=UPI002EDB16A4
MAPELMTVRATLDGDCRLITADPQLVDLHRRAGGREGGVLAVPQVAALARLARRLGVVISRGAIAADGDRDLELWVRAEPAGDRIELSIGGWTERAAHRPISGPAAEQEADFVRAAVDWTWETDETLRFTALGPGAAQATGRLPAELTGEQLTSLFRFKEHEDGSLPILNALAERRRFDDQLAELRIGTREAFTLSGVPLIDGAGRFAGFRGSATSISASLRDAAANDVTPPAQEEHDLTAFGERIDKALRDPLDHIIHYAEDIEAQKEGPLQPDYAGYAGDIASAGRHLLTLVDDLVDLQAIERPDFKPASDPMDLAEVARHAAQLLGVRASGKSVTIEAPAEALKLPVRGEYKRALQIVMNLVTNAIRYSPEGGTVRIAASAQKGVGSISVADEGKGIALADQQRIFEKFERVDASEPGGTGLGLYIARRLAEAMGGTLAVDSAPGEGARFTFGLPLERRR